MAYITRFALCETTKTQYAFTVDSETWTLAEEGRINPFLALINGTDLETRLNNGEEVEICAYDDDTISGQNEDGELAEARLYYTLKVKLNANRTGVQVRDFKFEALDPDTPLPAQHGSDTANLVRNRYNQPKRPVAPSNPPESAVDRIADLFKTRTDQTAANGHPGRRTPPKAYKVPDSKLEKLLLQYGADLTAKAANGELDPVVGRNNERKDIRQLMLRKKRASIMLLGEAGVGKTALAEALAQDIADGKAEAELSTARLFSLNLSAMNAGTQFRGTFEERLLPILEGLEERGGYLKGQKVILFIDEIHAALGAGKAIGSDGAGQIMKPYLSSGAFTCIGATTPEEYKKHIENDKALVRRFQPYKIEGTNAEDTQTILEGIQAAYSEHHNMPEGLSDEMLAYVVRMTERFMPTKQQPDKSIAICDDAMATARFNGRNCVTEADVVSAVAKATGLKENFLNQSDYEIYSSLEEHLKKRVIGQDEALEALASDLRASRAGLTSDKSPRGVFVFPGPTGVGKTETAKALAELLTGDEKNIVRLDMGKYQEKHTVSSLFGAPPGYVGHDNQDAGELTEPVRNRPFSIVLLDEIEKAHPDVFKSLLSVFDDGQLKDSKGRMVDFTNTIFIMTTNLGAKEMQNLLEGGSNTPGFSLESIENGADTQAPTQNKSANALREIAERNLAKQFPPELIGRLNSVICYRSLDKPAIGKILDLRLKEVEKNLRQSAHGLQLTNCNLIISQQIKNALAEKGYNPAKGARHMNNVIRKEVTDKLGAWMMQKENKETLLQANKNGSFKLSVSGLGDKFNVKVTVPKAANKAPKKNVSAPKKAV